MQALANYQHLSQKLNYRQQGVFRGFLQVIACKADVFNAKFHEKLYDLWLIWEKSRVNLSNKMF